MTLKLEGDRDILQMYPNNYTENEVASTGIQSLELELKNTKTCFKVKGQMSPTLKRFSRFTWDIFLPSYIDFRPVVVEIFCGQTHRFRQTPPKAIPARRMRARDNYSP